MNFFSGIRSLFGRISNLANVDLTNGVSEGIQIVRSAAVNLCPADTGELRQSISAEVEKKDGTVTGTCWTNKDYAVYVEFGTGQMGAADHTGISPDATPAYTMSPWWIHESQVDRSTAEKCHWFYIDTPQGRFYQCTGQAAQPFMYPALADNKEAIMEGIKTDFKAAIRGAIR